MSTIIKLRRDISENWEKHDPILYPHELAIDLSNRKLKIGDGVTCWNSLPYLDGVEISGMYARSLEHSTLITANILPKTNTISDEIIEDIARQMSYTFDCAGDQEPSEEDIKYNKEYAEIAVRYLIHHGLLKEENK